MTLTLINLLFSAGRVEKATNQRPLPKKLLIANKNARKALATGELASAEIELKKQKDLRTLYIKFKVIIGYMGYQIIL